MLLKGLQNILKSYTQMIFLKDEIIGTMENDEPLDNQNLSTIDNDEILEVPEAEQFKNEFQYNNDSMNKVDPISESIEIQDDGSKFLKLLNNDTKSQLDSGTFIAKSESDIVVEKFYRIISPNNDILKVLPPIPANKIKKKRNIKREPIISSQHYRYLIIFLLI